MDLAISADRKVEMKESKKIDKYLDLARELKEQWKMRVTVVLMVDGALGMVSKGLERNLEESKIRGRIETIQTTALLRSAKIQRKVLETWEDLLSLRL